MFTFSEIEILIKENTRAKASSTAPTIKKLKERKDGDN
jgi:hypothetical protein